MNANEKIYVAGFWCDSTEDNWKTGQDLYVSSSWGHRDVGFDTSQGFDTVGQALAAVCKSNSFKYDRRCWIDFGKDFGEERGRFDGDVLVDVDNAEAAPWEIEKWKKGETRLWDCHVVVRLEVRSVRPFGPDEEVDMREEQEKKPETAGAEKNGAEAKITPAAVTAAEKVLVDNGIEEDEASTVLQAVGYALAGIELYPANYAERRMVEVEPRGEKTA